MHFLPGRTEAKSVFTASPSRVRVLNISTGKELRLEINCHRNVWDNCGDGVYISSAIVFSNKRVSQKIDKIRRNVSQCREETKN